MKNLFTPVFLISLFLLFLVHRLEIAFWGILGVLGLALFVLGLTAYGLKRYRVSYVLIVMAIGMMVSFRFVQEKEAYFQVQESFPVVQDSYLTLVGELADFPEIEGENTSLRLQVQSYQWAGKIIPFTATIQVKVHGDLRGYFRGDTVELSARVYLPSYSCNFTGNRVEDYYLEQGIHLTGYCKSGQLVTLVRPGPLPWRILGKWRNQVREVIEGKYSTVASTSGTDKAYTGLLDRKGVFLLAILLGDRGELTEGDQERLIDAGIFHLLAISGAHIGMIALLVLWFCKRLGLTYKKRYLVTALILIFFLAITGFKISAERAVWMALLIFMARVFFMDTHLINIISFCGLMMLIRNPATFLDVGYILTFTLTAAIVMGRRIFLPWLQRLKKGQSFLWLWELLSANFSAWLVSLPLSLYYFQRFSFVGVLAGLFLVPLTGIINGIGFLLLVLVPVIPFLGGMVLAVLDMLMRLFFYLADIFSGVLRLSMYSAAPSLFLVVVMLAAFFLLGMVRTGKLRMVMSFIIVMIIVFLVCRPFIFYYSPAELEVFYLDVGQGDCQVVVFPGGDALLIDGGGAYFSDFSVGRKIVLPFLLQENIRIKWVAVSHFHPDHANGIAEILPIIQPEELWISSEHPGNETYDAVMAGVPGGTTIRRIASPFRMEIKGNRIDCLYPSGIAHSSSPVNNQSQVLRVSGLYHSFLFPGDIEVEVEQELVEQSSVSLNSTVLKVPHHGSKSSSSGEFLKGVFPRLAIFSYAHDNRFHFPHRVVVEKYQAKRIPWLSTARSGGIHLISHPDRLEIQTSK